MARSKDGESHDSVRSPRSPRGAKRTGSSGRSDVKTPAGGGGDAARGDRSAKKEEKGKGDAKEAAGAAHASPRASLPVTGMRLDARPFCCMCRDVLCPCRVCRSVSLDEHLLDAASGNMLDAQASLALSRDGKAVLVSVLNAVEIMSPVSRKRMLSLEGHAAAVTAVCVHPLNVSQAYTASFDGTVRLWDISDGANLKQWNLHQPIYQLVIAADGTYAYATILKSVAAEGNKAVSYVHQINLETNEQQRLFKCREPARLSLSRDGAMLLAVARRQLYVWLTSQSRSTADGGKKQGTSKAQAPLQLDHARDLVSVGCHPDGSFIATGDVRGEIFLWYQVKDSLLKPGSCAPICRCPKRADGRSKRALQKSPLMLHKSPAKRKRTLLKSPARLRATLVVLPFCPANQRLARAAGGARGAGGAGAAGAARSAGAAGAVRSKRALSKTLLLLWERMRPAYYSIITILLL